MNHDRNRRRFGKSNDELVEYFANAIGVRAQNLDNSGGAFNSHDAHWQRLVAMKSGHLARFDRTRATLDRLAPEMRAVLVVVYTPHGAPTWLLDALSPAWGGGSYVTLATKLPRALVAAEKRKPGLTVLDWMATRGRGDSALFRHLRDDAEAQRIEALAAYDDLRVERIRAEQAASRARKAERDRRNEELYLELTGRIRAKQAARFASKIKRAS
jgi:hypothetical protein